MGKLRSDAYHPEVISEVGELDELQTYVKKIHQIWQWTAVDHFGSGILEWVLGYHRSETFDSVSGCIGNDISPKYIT